ncbi:MAG: hypothetical protein ACKV2V_19240 [Blastocatellia bacterium]
MSWINELDQSRGGGRVVPHFSVLLGQTWSAPQNIAEGTNWFVYWTFLRGLFLTLEKHLSPR